MLCDHTMYCQSQGLLHYYFGNMREVGARLFGCATRPRGVGASSYIRRRYA